MTTIATVVVAAGTVGALYFTNQSLRATNNQYGLSQQTAVTDRFRLAAEQLASEKINVRISGIYLLERLAKDSPNDHATVFAVIAAFVRTQAPATDCPTNPTAARPIDIATALTVIGRRETTNESTADKPDLDGTCLTHAGLDGANLRDAILNAANLRGAGLSGANLSNAGLIRANLSGANLRDADLSSAVLFGANLSGAHSSGADLSRAALIGANLRDADLRDANLSEAFLSGANLIHANLSGANLREADLSEILYDDSTLWPTGFTPPPSRMPR
ncbi:pentapeptide repeat-containing protein [Nocardia goodfellowii]|uniref:Uncharacterized protein YjbI with pentapeptide repeats n=1 Tax=Nocardia goodfellowii TaxID=882446 RepID=A0ABS4QL24_9NOCA|nr:pentapeptide repeat-containing protein [Nocardia goodfellowii]MBP2191366.1 uncharacterized protein YjbI with pentapeptide repeats [Nocardia goodfellowii]